MLTRRSSLITLVFVFSAGGCASAEYGQATTRGDAPWYVIRISSPDTDIREGEVNVYKLLRRADSPEGRTEKLKADRSWGEGHGSVVRNSGGEIGTSVMITPDRSNPNTCGFELTAIYLEKKTQFSFVSTSAKEDSCEKMEFENPYFSARVQGEDRKWITLDFQFRRDGIWNLR